MKLSPETISILQNFCVINPSILFLEGSLQKTITPLKTVYAEAELKEEFPRKFAIHDLNTFLGVLSMFKTPELNFENTMLTITEGSRSATYKYCEPSLIVHPDEGKKVNFGEALFKFQLSADDLKMIVKAVSIYRHSHISIESDKGKVYVRTINPIEKQSDGSSILVGESDLDFRYTISNENIHLLPHDYDILITSKRKIVFESKNTKLMYTISVDSNHTREIKQ